ncbi:MAG: hypothetical protein E6I57_04285 [Chloroflexi bacterium]|nr:MAG: hypothetical protein E6J49_00835 [Chloroflexota bacterium]TMC25738.1 MAG: hypothetical protein E6J27_14530 [Chloroflexota bacterium]TMC34848.1 MAG: hypothetical protein E6J24_04975 [Chloroflexota bacterium]TMC58891.1 MAG: hypothetical protein E6J19_01465 [Chloroflexota bacterium]TME41769.1 MAG: hypothetical protein E6I57_04285 [Chloroflexota bacterium]
MRVIALIALAAILAGCGLFATPSPSPTVSASAQATATATAQATATPTPAPTPSPRPNPTAGPGTYTNAGLGYRVEIPAGWRRSQCQTTRGDPKVPFVETFTVGSVDEELGTDIGPATDVVSIRSEDAAGLTAMQWLSSGRLGAGSGQRFESFTFDGKDAARVVPIAGGAPTAIVVPGRGRMFVLSRGQRVFEPNTAVGANALINSFHVLTDAELAGPPFATPTPGPTRTAEDVAGAVAKGFTQKDTTALEPVAWACLTHGVENGGAGFASTAKTLRDLKTLFANGLVVIVSAQPFSDQKTDFAAIKGTWNEPGQPVRTVTFTIVKVGPTWYWDGWIDGPPLTR